MAFGIRSFGRPRNLLLGLFPAGHAQKVIPRLFFGPIAKWLAQECKYFGGQKSKPVWIDIKLSMRKWKIDPAFAGQIYRNVPEKACNLHSVSQFYYQHTINGVEMNYYVPKFTSRTEEFSFSRSNTEYYIESINLQIACSHEILGHYLEHVPF